MSAKKKENPAAPEGTAVSESTSADEIMAETAFSSVSRVKLKTDADRGDTRAKKALFISDNFDRAITTILICTNIIHITAASIVTVQVTRTWASVVRRWPPSAP